MREKSLHFASSEQYEQFRKKELLSKFPEGCLGCAHLELTTYHLATAVDRNEMSETGAIQTANEKGMQTAEDCTYGYSREYGCGSGVLCRMD